MSKLASVVFLSPALCAVSACVKEATELGEEIAVPVDYLGRQIQLTGWLEKPAGAGPFPVVIALHSCGAMRPKCITAPSRCVSFLQGQGYGTFKLDSFTARLQQRVRAQRRERPRRCWRGGRRSGPTASPSLAGRMAAPLRCTLRATTSNCGRCGRGWRLTAAGSRPASGSTQAATASEGNPVIVPLLR